MPEQFVIDDTLFTLPDERPSSAPVRRGPNIPPLPEIEPVPAVLEGPAVIKVGNNITTDHIVPAGAHFLPIRNNIPEISRHVFRVVDGTFPERAKQAGTGFIVAGDNYGQGSSREQAALAPRYLGIRAVLAKGFARIHRANLVNFGLLPLVFVNPADYGLVAQGDVLRIETGDLREGKTCPCAQPHRGNRDPGNAPPDAGRSWRSSRQAAA